MDRTELYDKLADILVDQLSVKKESITETSLIAADLGADSLDTAELAMKINDELGYDLTDEDMKHIQTVGDVLDILQKNLKPEVRA